VGAVTHLVWDGFTHEGARGIRMMPELDDWKFELHGHHLIGARLLQDGSSLLGLAIVLILLIYALRRGENAGGGPARTGCGAAASLVAGVRNCNARVQCRILMFWISWPERIGR